LFLGDFNFIAVFWILHFYKFNPAVICFTFGCNVVADWFGIAKAFGTKAPGIKPPCLLAEPLRHRRAAAKALRLAGVPELSVWPSTSNFKSGLSLAHQLSC